jgi:acyl carrier protein
MTRAEFIRDFAEVLGTTPDLLDLGTELGTLDAWDSVAYLSTLVMIDDKLGVNLSPDALRNAITMGDILKAVESKLEG